MRQSEIAKFKRERARDLKSLYEVLINKLGVNKEDIYSIIEASNNLSQDANSKSTDDYWGYDIRNVLMPFSTTKHLVPKEMRNARLILNCYLKGHIPKWDNGEDPFEEYSFSAVIYGYHNSEVHSVGWHVDRDNPTDSDEYHPLYHMQYSNGTTALKHNHIIENADSFEWGNLISIDTPRIPHYPMDMILGIGFGLTQFNKKGIFEMFLDDAAFGPLYRKSQNAVMKPYYQYISSHWSTSRSGLSTLLCPQLC